MTDVFIQTAEWEKLKQGIILLAKQQVLSRFEKVTAETKSDGSLLTEADTEMQKATESFLKTHWPQFAFLGEESSAEAQAKALASTDGCWILDPVDGTSNFANGIPVFTISLALIISENIQLGLVYDPSRDELFAARLNQGAELNHQPLKAHAVHETLKRSIALVDFKRLSFGLASQMIQDNPFASQRSIGSVALDWCWIAAGRGQLYCHGAQNIWDYAAGWLILEEAGGKSCTLEEEVVVVSKVTKRSAVAATTPTLFRLWRDYLQKAQATAS